MQGPFTNDGSVDFNDGIGKFAGAISGTGSFDISNGSTLQFDRGVSSGQQVDFQPNAANTLTLESASSFHGTIEDFFTGGDTVGATTFAKKAHGVCVHADERALNNGTWEADGRHAHGGPEEGGLARR